MNSIREMIAQMAASIAWDPAESELLAFVLPYLTAVTRIVLPALAVLVLFRAVYSLFKSKNEPELWGWLMIEGGSRLAINHLENIIGRGVSADIIINLPVISRNHATLIRDKDGGWTLTNISGKANVYVNGEPIESCSVSSGDEITLAGTSMMLAELSDTEEALQRKSRTMPGRELKVGHTLLMLSLFMLLQAVQLCATAGDMVAILNIAFGYVWLIILMWVSWISSRMLRRRGFEIETLAFFLTSLGWAVIASAVPSAMFKQGIALLLGLICFGVLGFLLRDMQRIKALRWPMAGLALLLLLYVLFFGESIFGARNWISIGSFSLQPSELVKICFIFAGAATLDRLFARRNLYSFIALSMAIVGLLALMSDFGTAAIFFVVFLIIAYLRSGDVATIALAIAAAALAIILVVSFKPYIGARFATWGHAWEYMYSSGYQQASAMSALASGGLFGMGGGQGWLHYIAAADTDLVFALVAEEWGFIIALSALLAVMAMAGFAVKESTNARSSYYVIAACGTAGLFVFQLMLNVGGSLDLLPLTGVTFPFVSNGGSSLIACWGLLAFLKAADTRRNASFATPVMRRRRRKLAANIVTDIEVDDVIAWEVDADE